MARQLSLLDTPPSWRIDPATRELGRRGVAEARAKLQAALAAARTEPTRTHGREHPSHGRSAA